MFVITVLEEHGFKDVDCIGCIGNLYDTIEIKYQRVVNTVDEIKADFRWFAQQLLDQGYHLSSPFSDEEGTIEEHDYLWEFHEPVLEGVEEDNRRDTLFYKWGWNEENELDEVIDYDYEVRRIPDFKVVPCNEPSN